MELRLATYVEEGPLPKPLSNTTPGRGLLKIHGLLAACILGFYGAHFRNYVGSTMYPRQAQFKSEAQQYLQVISIFLASRFLNFFLTDKI